MIDYNKKKKRLIVKKIINVTKNMIRVTFYHKDLASFPSDEIGGYVKFIFKKNNKDLVRPFTVRNFRKAKLELDVDFAVHNEEKGLASSWVINTTVGDTIEFTGPGPKKIINFNSNWFLLIGDMASLPAISVNLEQMPKNSRGYAIIEISNNNDKQKLLKPKNMQIFWILNSDRSHSIVLNKIQRLKWIDNQPSIWVATEFSLMKKIRAFLLKKNNTDKEKIYFSSYWKKGLDQEQHKLIKKEDARKWM